MASPGMDPEEVDRLFDEASSLPPERRRAFLDDACRGSPELRNEIQSLLDAGEAASDGRFLGTALHAPPGSGKGAKSTGAAGSAADALPEHASFGPYRVLRRLGKGGMGVVYEAEHATSGRRVALKTVSLVSQGDLSSIRREIHSLARIEHPGIVRIVDEGVHQGVPWYAMELVEGFPLRESSAARSRKDVRASRGASSMRSGYVTTVRYGSSDARGAAATPAAPGSSRAPRVVDAAKLAEALTLIRRLCAPLAYLHGEGLVHRDLKPDNILVRGDGMPVLVDFGLSVTFGGTLAREQLQAEAYIVGTIAYMSPEQARGEMVDARSDLYSLGCVLYELCAGRPPFVGSQQMDVLLAHLHEDPEPPSRHAHGLPKALDDLILHLLAKDPRERLGHADVVAARLAALGAEDGLAVLGPRPRSYLYRSQFVGRQEPMDRIESALKELGEGQGGLLLIGGESGVGKTRLLVEAAALARGYQARVLTGECRNVSGSGGAHALGGWRKPLESIADLCREGGRELCERLLGPRAKLLGRYEPSLLDLPGQEEAAEPADLPPEEARLRLCSYMAETLELLSGEGPLLCLLDDVQWADDLSFLVLRFLMEGGSLARRPILIVAAYRSEEMPQEIGRLERLPGVAAIALPRLPSQAVGDMVADMLAIADPPEAFAAYLARQSEGNPFFIAEYLRAAVQEGLLYRQSDGSWRVTTARDLAATQAAYEALPLPGSVRELVSRRIEGLTSVARRVVLASSVLGREIDGTLLPDIAALPEEGMLDGISQLLARQVLEDAGNGQYRFVHDKIREVAYAALPETLLAGLHRAAAQTIEGRLSVDEHLASLGHHWERAGDAARAQGYYLKAARRSVARYSYDEGRRLFEAYLRLASEPSQETIAARSELAEKALHLLGESDKALAELARALQEARALPDRAAAAACLRAMGVIHKECGRMDDGHSCLDSALALHREAGDDEGEAKALASLAGIDVDQGRVDQARERCEQALAIQRRVGDRLGALRTLTNLALALHHRGRFEEAGALYEESLQMAVDAGDRADEGKLLSYLASLHYHLGRADRARDLYDRALVVAREVGDQRLHGTVTSNLAVLYMDKGELDRARSSYEETFRIYERIGDLRLAAQALTNLGALHHQQGEVVEARKLYDRALSVTHALGDKKLQGVVLANLAELARDEGHRAEARARYAECLELLREVGAPREEAYVQGELGRLHLDEGKPEEARRHFERGLALARELGDGHMEGAIMTGLAKLCRWTNDLETTLHLVRRAEELLAGSDDKLERMRCRIERAHADLATGSAPRAALPEAEVLAAEIGGSSETPFGQAIRALGRAVEAHAKGRPLVRGESAQSLPHGLKHILARE